RARPRTVRASTTILSAASSSPTSRTRSFCPTRATTCAAPSRSCVSSKRPSRTSESLLSGSIL
ncbi:hypothetical protein PHISP_08884, partial [Aspergillus sp. HF37]